MMVRRAFERVQKKQRRRYGVIMAVLVLAAGAAAAYALFLHQQAARQKATAQELFNACVARGGKSWDHSAMVRGLEAMANFEIGQPAR